MPDPTTGTGPDGGATPAAGRSGGRREQVRSTPLGNLLVLAVVTALVLAGAWLMNRSEEPGATPVDVVAGDTPPPEVGAPATDFTATTTEGEQVRLRDYVGQQPVWISFVATWCSSCRSEAPDVQAAWEDSGEEVVVLSVYLAEDAAPVSSYAERLGMTYPQIPDPQNVIASQYRVVAVPSHVFIDRDGNVASTHVGVLTPEQMASSMAQIAGP